MTKTPTHWARKWTPIDKDDVPLLRRFWQAEGDMDNDVLEICHMSQEWSFRVCAKNM